MIDGTNQEYKQEWIEEGGEGFGSAYGDERSEVVCGSDEDQ